jgi:curved DNA binding protein
MVDGNESSDDELMPPPPPTEVAEGAAPSAEDEKNASLANPDVVTKYKEAAKIAQSTLQEIIAKCVVGARIVDICKFGDETIEAKCGAVFKAKVKGTGKAMSKGVAFPVCVSANEFVCHCSPLESEAEDTYPALQENDMVKIDMGVHIDGFIAAVAHTLIVGHDSSMPAKVEAIKGVQSDVINATYVAAEVASKMIKEGSTNAQVTAAIKQVAELFEVRPINGTLIHQMKQYVIDGNKKILLANEHEGQKADACTFESLEVYAIDVAFTSGDGKSKESGNRTTVFKRAVEKKYSLKNKASRTFFNDVNKAFPTMPFSLRSLPDEKASKMGVRECVTHELLMSYPVFQEKKGDFVAHSKFTVLLLPNSTTLVITGVPPLTWTGAADDKNIGLALCNQKAAAKGSAVPENLTELLSLVAVEVVKKDKKPKKKKSAAAAEEAK